MLVLLLGGLAVAWAMDSIHEPVIRELSQASRAALAGDWQLAGKHAAMAQAKWDNNWNFTATLADHTPMEEIDGLFAELQIFLLTREDVHFAATCARLCQLTKDMTQAHTVSWENFLCALLPTG